jgi:hypothetical protein
LTAFAGRRFDCVSWGVCRLRLLTASLWKRSFRAFLPRRAEGLTPRKVEVNQRSQQNGFNKTPEKTKLTNEVNKRFQQTPEKKRISTDDFNKRSQQTRGSQ